MKFVYWGCLLGLVSMAITLIPPAPGLGILFALAGTAVSSVGYLRTRNDPQPAQAGSHRLGGSRHARQVVWQRPLGLHLNMAAFVTVFIVAGLTSHP